MNKLKVYQKKSVSKRGITYTDEFKILLIAERSKGKLPIHIFQDAEFDVDVIGNHRIWSARKDGVMLIMNQEILV